MTAFTNSSESDMYAYDSPNATNFTQVRANAYTPPSGLIRDPSVIRHADGYRHLGHTTNWTGSTIGFARSADFTAWTFLRNVTVGLNGPTDSFIVKVGGTYHNFPENETTKYVEHATATSLDGPWRFVGTGDRAGWGSGLEGPAPVRLPDGRWRLYFDQYGNRRYHYADSADLNSFGARVELPGLSGTVRHFTVLRGNVGDGTAVPTGARSLRSANAPDRYVGHRDNHFIRRHNYEPRLDLRAADPTFAGDASSTVTSPLA
jgi:hypothetical protein